ncbi:alpha/beta fold hydrolase [Natronosporangium hydrolyticum]|uniref:Alpha/beta fold hydrolase n=1 Tax=Natronosporangium hydrolyticum TaxID=2811111 RepID=A0A895YDT9_9ACTN|nr:alpha/beta fold hydrolase [Natronosporangium hydrolyticum]QSB15974.1 alpha/beta fold hydrolase [Natronosporangium hydrolyticum]
MGWFFDDPLHEEFATGLGLGLISHGGGEPGEVRAICARIRDGDDDSWYEQWTGAADRLVATGDTAAEAGRSVSAREAYLIGALYYGIGYHPLFGGPPVDERLRSAFDRQRNAFSRAVAHLDPPPEPIGIPFEGARLPAYLCRSPLPGRRPLLVATNGYDATLHEMYFAHAVPAVRRGYHCLIFDGPGQGAVLYEQGVPLRPDWETVVAAVLDAVIGGDGIDPDRVALVGWSLGGYLALRAASGEPRLAACVADPGLYSIATPMIGALRAAGVPDSALEHFPQLSESVLRPVAAAIEQDRGQRWKIQQRGFWAHGVTDLAGYLAAVAPFTLAGRVSQIRCPTLITVAEHDPLAAGGPATYDQLVGERRLVRFSQAEGADMHCELLNRTRYDQRVFDWLDQVLAR